MRAKLTLRLPREDEEQELLRAHRTTSPGAPYFLHHYTEGMPFARYLENADADGDADSTPNDAPRIRSVLAYVSPQ